VQYYPEKQISALIADPGQTPIPKAGKELGGNRQMTRKEAEGTEIGPAKYTN